MRKSIYFKRVTVCILATAVLLSSVTGCGKKKSSTDGSAVVQNKALDKEHIFKEEEIKDVIEKGSEELYLDYVGDKIKCVYLDKAGKYKFVSANTDGTVEKSYEIPVSTNDRHAYFTMDDSENLYMQYSEYEDEESDKKIGYYLVKFDNTGKEVVREDLLKDGPEISIFSVQGVAWTKDNGLVISSSRGLDTYSEQNGFTRIIEPKDLNRFEYGGLLIKGSNDQLYIKASENNEAQLMKVDLANKKIGEPIKCFGANNIKNKYYALSGGEGYDLYVSCDRFIYGYDSKLDKLTKIANLRDSDIGYEEGINNFVAVNEGEFFVTFFEENGGEYFSRLTKVNPEDIKERTVITLGGISIRDEVLNEVYKFNRTNDEYRIQVIDYAEDSFSDGLLDGDEADQAINKFNLDVLSGKAPDILAIEDGYADISNYIDKGVLMDLGPLFEKGGALGNIEILPNVFEMMHTNGKLYTVFSGFDVSTIAMRSRFAEGRTSLSVSDCDEIINKTGCDYKTAFGSESNKQCVLYLGLDNTKFLDQENKKCNFTDPEFIELLNFANKFPEEAGYDYGIFDLDLGYLEDKAIFRDSPLYNFKDYGMLKHAVFRDDVALVGLLNNSGENSAEIVPCNKVGINSKSKYTEVAVQFIKNMFENYDPLNDYSQFPSDKASFEAAKKAATEKNGNKTDYYNLGYEKVEVTPFD